MNYQITKLNKIVYKIMRKKEVNLNDHRETSSSDYSEQPTEEKPSSRKT